MADEEKVYINAMVDSLEKKKKILADLYEKTCEQEESLHNKAREAADVVDILNNTMDEKDDLLVKLAEADEGFETLHRRVAGTLEAHKNLYKPQLQRMQAIIREITDLGVSIEKKEKSNKQAFDAFIQAERKKIGGARTNNKSAVSYYQNMPGQHREWQTYFLDEKN